MKHGLVADNVLFNRGKISAIGNLATPGAQGIIHIPPTNFLSFYDDFSTSSEITYGSAAVIQSDPVFGKILTCNGTTGAYAVDLDGETYLNGLSEFTICAWVNPNYINHDRGIVMGVLPNGADNLLSLRYDAAGWISNGVRAWKAGVQISSTRVAVIEGRSYTQKTGWQHITLRWKSGVGVDLFYDGDIDTTPKARGVTAPSSATLRAESPVGAVYGLDRLLVGKGTKDAGSSWSGSIADFRIYGYALSNDSVKSVKSEFNP